MFFLLLVIAAVVAVLVVYGPKFLEDQGCVKNAYGQCTTGEFSP